MSWKILLVRRVSELTCLPQKRNTDAEIIKPGSLHVPAANGAEQVLQKLEAEGKVAQHQHGRWQIADQGTF